MHLKLILSINKEKIRDIMKIIESIEILHQNIKII